MINNENVQLLIDALRSGEFKQGTGALRKTHPEGDKYCCLGVACEVFRRHTQNVLHWGPSTLPEILAFRRSDTDSGDISFLPLEVKTWFGFPITDPMLDYNAGRHSAIDLNDGLKLSFPEIADALERTFLEKKDAQKILVSDRWSLGAQDYFLAPAIIRRALGCQIRIHRTGGPG